MARPDQPPSTPELARLPGTPSTAAPASLPMRLLRHGAHTLTDVELLSLVIANGDARTDSVWMAERLLAEVGGLTGLSRVHPETLAQLAGLGEPAAARVLAALALPWRRDATAIVAVERLADLVPVFRPLLTGLAHERVVVAVCDRRRRVRAVRTVADGDGAGAPFPIRDIILTALRYSGHAFAIAHNHPSGDPVPSSQDRRASWSCSAAARPVGLEFLGHVVIGEHTWWREA